MGLRAFVLLGLRAVNPTHEHNSFWRPFYLSEQSTLFLGYIQPNVISAVPFN